ncbi:MAG: hypothetical protein KGI98_16895, partial [Euryarchaeota archaeon]|nr:hypothetical protein [Euryarchaeota archaeon]
PACPMTFNGSTQANMSSGTFLQGNYTVFAPVCPGYAFQESAWAFTPPGGGLQSGSQTGNPGTIDVVGNGSVWVIYWRSASPPTRYALQFAVSPGGCGPISFNGTSQANGTSSSFLASTYAAHAPACAGHPFRGWIYAFPTQRIVYLGTWANISIGSAGTLFAN